MRSIDPVIRPKIAEASPTPAIVLLEGRRPSMWNCPCLECRRLRRHDDSVMGEFFGVTKIECVGLAAGAVEV